MKIRYLLSIVLAFAAIAHVASAAPITCQKECNESCTATKDTTIQNCQRLLQMTMPLPADYQARYDACSTDQTTLDTETNCKATCVGLPTTCTVAPAATSPSGPTPEPGAGWLTLVPFDCRDADGCDICEVTKIFTNGTNFIALGLSATSLLMFVLGGLTLIFSAGNEQRVTRGKQIIVGAVSGIAVIFLAWLTVNFIVRTASVSGGTTNTATVFSSEWWEFESCYPDLPTSCQGRSVGSICGFDRCSSSNTKDPSCRCYRQLDSTGDTNLCDGEDITTGDINQVLKGKNKTGNPKKQCMCADACTLLRASTGQAYGCYADQTVKDNPTQYTKAENTTCGKPGFTCALAAPGVGTVLK